MTGLRDETVYIRPGSTIYHDSADCAGKRGLPTMPEIIAGQEDYEPCGLCEPHDWVQCERCGKAYQSEKWLKRHHFQDHVRGSHTAEQPEGDDSWRELDRKARGETDV